MIPSLSFTAMSALTALVISRRKRTEIPLYLGQLCLVLGAGGLVAMAAVFPRNNVPSWVYNMVLVLPAAGASMMAPSALLTLLNMSSGYSHAVVNATFIMARSLGVFMATALSATTVQNRCQLSFKSPWYDPTTRRVCSLSRVPCSPLIKLIQKLEEARQNIDLIPGLDEATQAKCKF